MHTRRIRTLGIALLLGVVPLATAGCAHSGDSKATSSAPAAGVDGGTANGASKGRTPASTPPTVDLAVARRPGSDRQVISTAELDLRARDLDATIGRATSIVVAAGGYAFAETASLTSARHAHVVFKVPPERFADVIARLGRLGTLVHRQIGTQDVTGRVVDLGARLQAAQTSAARLRDLMANSSGLGDLLNLENQLTTREGEVDTLAGELAALRAQVDMATVTLEISPTPERAAPAAPAEPPGFQRGLRAGARAFSGTARVVEAVVGIVLPFVPVLLLAGVVWWLLRRRGKAEAPAG
jgi:hypothetical protein